MPKLSEEFDDRAEGLDDIPHGLGTDLIKRVSAALKAIEDGPIQGMTGTELRQREKISKLEAKNQIYKTCLKQRGGTIKELEAERDKYYVGGCRSVSRITQLEYEIRMIKNRCLERQKLQEKKDA